MDRAECAELQVWTTQLADGDRRAFHPVFERLWPLVRGFVAKQVPSPDADDVAQQTLLKVFERAGEFDPRLDALLDVNYFHPPTSITSPHLPPG